MLLKINSPLWRTISRGAPLIDQCVFDGGQKGKKARGHNGGHLLAQSAISPKS